MWNDTFPDWQDAGRAIKARLKESPDSSEITGVLYYDEIDRDENGDEWPVWRIRVVSGKHPWLALFDEWMFV